MYYRTPSILHFFSFYFVRLTSIGQSSPDKIVKMSLSLPRNVLTPDEIYKHYREAIIHYSKV